MSWGPSISGDGGICGVLVDASISSPGDTNAVIDVFVHDRQTECRAGSAWRPMAPKPTEGPAYREGGPSISGDGRFVAFVSNASNLVPVSLMSLGGIVYVHDRQTERPR